MKSIEKYQPQILTLENLEEFATLLEEQNFTFAKCIVEGILKNIDTDVPEVHLMEITIKSQEATYDIVVSREDFAYTLGDNLPHYIKAEEYEQCRRIADTIEELRKGNLSEVIANLKSQI